MAEKEYIEKVEFNYAIREAVKKYPNTFYNGLETARKIAHDFPAADVRPVVRGKWIEAFIKDGIVGEVKTLTCSACGYTYGEIFHNPLYNFCPNCGADMREES